MSNEPKQAENGDRLLCDPWRGARTPEFRKFKRDFKASADALFLHEDDYSVWQAMADADQGGRAQNADALPGPNQAGHANAVRRRKRRQKTAFKIVYKHIDNERIKVTKPVDKTKFLKCRDYILTKA